MLNKSPINVLSQILQRRRKRGAGQEYMTQLEEGASPYKYYSRLFLPIAVALRPAHIGLSNARKNEGPFPPNLLVHGLWMLLQIFPYHPTNVYY